MSTQRDGIIRALSRIEENREIVVGDDTSDYCADWMPIAFPASVDRAVRVSAPHISLQVSGRIKHSAPRSGWAFRFRTPCR